MQTHPCLDHAALDEDGERLCLTSSAAGDRFGSLLFVSCGTISWQRDVDQPRHEITSFGAVRIFNATEDSPARLTVDKVNDLLRTGCLRPVVLSFPCMSEWELAKPCMTSHGIQSV